MVGVLTFSPVITQAMTVQEQIASLQAQLNALLQILNQLLAQQGQTATTTVPTSSYVNASFGELSKAGLYLSYDSSRGESSLDANQGFSVVAGDQDVYVVGASISFKRNGSVGNKSLIPNGAVASFYGIENATQQTFTDSHGNVNSGWLVKAYNKAKFKVALKANPQKMYSGVYTAELAYVGGYSQGDYGEVGMKGVSLPSDSVTIVGENAFSSVKELSQANLSLAYSVQSKESALNSTQSFSVTAGNQDVYVVSAGFKLSKNGVVSSKWVPNGTTNTLTGTGVTTQSFKDNYGNTNNGWLVRAGQTATFGASMSMNPQLMYSGVYTAELSGIQVYSQNAWNSVALTGNSMPSIPVTIVGENANPTTPLTIKLTSSPVASDKVFPSGQNLMNFRVTYDSSKFEPAAVILTVTCPSGVDASFSGETSSRCTKVTMNKIGNGTYDLTLLFKNSNTSASLVGGMALALDAKGLPVATDKDAFNLDPKTGIGALPVTQASDLLIIANQSTYNAGQKIKYSIKGYTKDGSTPTSARGFHVQASMQEPDAQSGVKTVVVNGVAQAVNSTYNAQTGYWDVEMDAPTDTSKTYTIDSAFYCSMPVERSTNSSCSDGQISKKFTFTITGGATQPSITIISPNGGETFSTNDSIKVSWQTNYKIKNPIVFVQDIDTGYSINPVIHQGDPNVSISPNAGISYYSFPLSEISGIPDGKFRATVCDNDTSSPVTVGKPLCDSSDNYFTITNPTQTQQTPAVSLTVNGSHSVTVKPGDSVTYSWLNLFNKADKFSSNYTTNASYCGSGPWVVNTSNGSGTYPILTWQVGCTYTITYTGTQSSTGIKASDTITVSVVSQPVVNVNPGFSPVIFNPSQNIVSSNTPIPTVNPVKLNITSASSPISYNSDFTLIGTGLDKVMDVYIGNYVWQKDISFTASSDGTQIKFKINSNIAPGTYNVYADSVSTGSLVKSNVLTVNVVAPTSLNQTKLDSLASALEALKSLLGSFSR